MAMGAAPQAADVVQQAKSAHKGADKTANHPPIPGRPQKSLAQRQATGETPELVELQLEDEERLEKEFAQQKSTLGLDNQQTLITFFDLFDVWIQLYRLNKIMTALEEVVPVCRKRGDQFKIKAIQALSFTLWKQSKFSEAVKLFHEMEELVGKNAALCENIGHTYSSMGDYPKAEEYFQDALEFTKAKDPEGEESNLGGILLGLGLVKERLGDLEGALPNVLEAYQYYKKKHHPRPASLTAKAGMSASKLLKQLGQFPKAEEFAREGVEIFKITCGETNPLTAGALHDLGDILWCQRRREEAREALHRAYELEVMKDAFSLITVLEIHNLLMDTYLKDTTEIVRGPIKNHFPIVDAGLARVRKDLQLDGNTAVYLKAVAELRAWGADYSGARSLFQEAIEIFAAEETTDCRHLIEQCTTMLSFCDRNLGGRQSPMVLSVGGEAPKEANANPGDDEPSSSSGGTKGRS